MDVPLSVAELQAKRLVQFPTAIGGVVPVVNVPGVVPGALNLSGPVVAGMFLGQIKVWNDPEIAALNPSLPLPSVPVKVVHSMEPSGATYLFTSYLAAVSREWKQKVGAGLVVPWPVGDVKNDVQGVVNLVQKTVGGIGYADYTYAVDQGVAKPKLRNRNGEFVAPTVLSFQAAVARAPWESTPAFSLLLVDPPWPGSWPLTSPTFAVMPVIPPHPERTLALLKFFYWGFEKGGAATSESGYVSLTPELVRLVSSAWKRQIKRPDGRPLWDGS
jgi:phosphate transport system substrate-binding protein